MFNDLRLLNCEKYGGRCVILLFAIFRLANPVILFSSACSSCSSLLFEISNTVRREARLILAGRVEASLLVYLISRKFRQLVIKSFGTSRERFRDRLRDMISVDLWYRVMGIVIKLRPDKSTWLNLASLPNPGSLVRLVKPPILVGRKENRTR